MGIPVVGEIIKGVGNIVDDLHTSGEEKRAAALEERKLNLESERLEHELLKAQAKINEVEAGHPSLFVAGPRPAIIWICAAGLGYNYLLYPVLVWGWTLMQAWSWVPRELPPPQASDISELMPLLIAMLGIAGFKTFERKSGVDTTKRVSKGF